MCQQIELLYPRREVFEMEQDKPWFAATDIGWVVGSNLVGYGPLCHRVPSIIYEGKPTNPGNDYKPYFRLMEKYDVATFWTSPTAMRSIKNVFNNHGTEKIENLLNKTKNGSLKDIWIAGEHCERDTLEFIRAAFQTERVHDHWWQTESGWPITCVNQVPDQPIGSSGLPVPGWNVQLLDSDTGERITKPNVLGNVVCKLPLPPGALTTLWQNEEFYNEYYFSKYPGFYDTMDSGTLDENGYLTIAARMDDVLKVAGARLACGSLEECITNVKGIIEAVVVGKNHPLKGQVPFAFLVIRDGYDKQEMVNQARDSIIKDVGPTAAIHEFMIVKRLPKTRSGKTPRATLQKFVNGEEFVIPVTIEDESVYDELRSDWAKNNLRFLVKK